MAITITDLRTLVDHADATTGWSSPVAGESITVFTTEPDPVELTGSLGIAVSTQTSDLLHTETSSDLSAGVLVYVWILANGTMDTTANGGIQLIIGDGTDTIGYHLAGSDVAGFRHSDGPVGWQCLVLDVGSLPASFTALRGAEASLTLTAVTEYGAAFKTLSKALGGTENCFVDTIRRGNEGIEVTAGTSGTPSNWTDIATEDRSTVSGTAYGICRELGTGLFGLQGPITFGDADNTTATFFADTNKTITFEDRGLGTDKYTLIVRAGGATGTTTFRMGTISGTELGVDGSNFICPAGVGAAFDASNTTLQSLLLYGTTFTNFDQGMLFSADATNGPNHDIFSCSFVGCSQVDPGKVDFRNNTIAASTDSATGSILLDADGTSTWSDLTFTSGGTGHAIYITATGTYTFSDFTYIGFGDADTTDASVFNDSGGAVTINVSGGASPTVRNGASASTTVNNSTSLTITGIPGTGAGGGSEALDSEIRIYTTGTTTELDGAENVSTGSFVFTFNTGGNVDIVILNLDFEYFRLVNFPLPVSNASQAVILRRDRNFSNP